MANEKFQDKIFLENKQNCIQYLASRSKENATNFESKYINIVSDERSGEKCLNISTEDWLFFGGSTVQCLEVEDKSTVSSMTQSLLNADVNCFVQTHNFGFNGQRIRKVKNILNNSLLKYPHTKKVIFYFGVNDCGWLGGSAQYFHQSVIDCLLIFLGKLFKTIEYLHCRVLVLRQRRYSKNVSMKTISKLLEFQKLLKLSNIESYFILQPNLFCKVNLSKTEVRLLEDVPPLFIAGVAQAYRSYLTLSTELITSAITLFNDVNETIYLDWCHIGLEGNRLIAKSVHDIINEKKSDWNSDQEVLKLIELRSKDSLSWNKIRKNRDESVYNYPLC